MSYHRKGENRPVLSGRAARRADRRCEARNTAKTQGVRILNHHGRALIFAANSGWFLAGEFLSDMGFPEADRYASAFGRKVAETYRKNHRRDPHSGCKAVANGRVWTVFGYDNPADLMAGARAYKRTAAFLGITTTAVPKPRATRELVAV